MTSSRRGKKAPRSSPRSTGSTAREPEVYDKAAWHLEADWPRGLPEEQACVHAGLFLGWVLDRGLASARFVDGFPDLVEAFRSRRQTGPRIYALAGGVLASDMLNATGNAFARAYYDLRSGSYLADYTALLAAGLPSAYHVPDTWASYVRILQRLDQRFAEWEARRGGGRGP